MLVVLASRYDASCQKFVTGKAADARLLTCRDLSVRGWQYDPGGEVRTSVIDGRLTGEDEIDGVLTRLPSVVASELADIVPRDRSYAAAEMTAFLSAWLSDLRCPVLNQPTPVCLMGPIWRKEKWIHTAAKLGITVVPARRSVPAAIDAQPHDLPPGSATVNVIGDLCVGIADQSLGKSARALAEAAGVDLLRARFTSPAAGSAFLGADYWVDINDPEVSEAVWNYFAGGRRR